MFCVTQNMYWASRHGVGLVDIMSHKPDGDGRYNFSSTLNTGLGGEPCFKNTLDKYAV